MCYFTKMMKTHHYHIEIEEYIIDNVKLNKKQKLESTGKDRCYFICCTKSASLSTGEQAQQVNLELSYVFI